MQAVAETNGLVDETIPASNETPAPEAAPVMLPVCPHCSEDPAKLSLMSQQFPSGMIGTIIFCGNPNCRKIISTQIVGMQQKEGQ